MGWFQRNAPGRNKIDEIEKRERTILTTDEQRYGRTRPPMTPSLSIAGQQRAAVYQSVKHRKR
jgi:hypothetical protein